jgi:hypothetical protein
MQDHLVAVLPVVGPLVGKALLIGLVGVGIRRIRTSWRRSLQPASSRTIVCAERWLELLAALLPRRIANEEIADALEMIHQMAEAARPRCFIAIKVATTYFWVGLHTLLHCGERVAGIVKVVTGKSDKG